MDLLNEDIWAYLAGLIDADGSITIVNRTCKYKGIISQGYRIKIYVYNCNTKIISYLKNLLGGRFRSNNINKTHSKWRNCLEYSASDKKAVNIIASILPYLIIKKKQALIALQVNDIKNKYNIANKIWHPELKIECDTKMAKLKTQINELNIRGTQKQFETIDITNIPYNINYLAGFCDADGSIMIVKSEAQPAIAKITFTNTDKNVINWIKYYLGGSLYIKNQKNNKWNTVYELTFTSRKAYNLSEQLYPYLKIKQQQAKLLIALGKMKKQFSLGNLRYNSKKVIKHKILQEKIKSKCAALNKRSI